jgi:hypothetical protein
MSVLLLLGGFEPADFSEALPSASHTEIIRRAVSAYIRDFLNRNEGVREDYEQLRRARGGVALATSD